jgi:hypothetical protein
MEYSRGAFLVTRTTESIVKNYMRRLERRLSGLPPYVASDVVAQVSEHIAASLSAISNPSESDVRKVLAEVGSPESIAMAAATEFPSTHRVSLRTLSLWAYTLWYGAIWGSATFGYTTRYADGTSDTGMIWVWVIAALTGSTLAWIKNRRIDDPEARTRMNLTDVGIAATGLLLAAVLPSYLGLVRSLVLVALFAVYAGWWYLKKAVELRIS